MPHSLPYRARLRSRDRAHINSTHASLNCMCADDTEDDDEQRDYRKRWVGMPLDRITRGVIGNAWELRLNRLRKRCAQIG
jgi:hypothetical protein